MNDIAQLTYHVSQEFASSNYRYVVLLYADIHPSVADN